MAENPSRKAIQERLSKLRAEQNKKLADLGLSAPTAIIHDMPGDSESSINLSNDPSSASNSITGVKRRADGTPVGSDNLHKSTPSALQALAEAPTKAAGAELIDGHIPDFGPETRKKRRRDSPDETTGLMLGQTGAFSFQAINTPAKPKATKTPRKKTTEKAKTKESPQTTGPAVGALNDFDIPTEVVAEALKQAQKQMARQELEKMHRERYEATQRAKHAQLLLSLRSDVMQNGSGDAEAEAAETAQLLLDLRSEVKQNGAGDVEAEAAALTTAVEEADADEPLE